MGDFVGYKQRVRCSVGRDFFRLNRARAYVSYPTRPSGFSSHLLVRNSFQQSTVAVLPGPTGRNLGSYLYAEAQHPDMLSQRMRFWEGSRRKFSTRKSILNSESNDEKEFEEKDLHSKGVCTILLHRMCDQRFRWQ